MKINVPRTEYQHIIYPFMTRSVRTEHLCNKEDEPWLENNNKKNMVRGAICKLG